jgi:predicted RNase H-like HicB family nuclease
MAHLLYPVRAEWDPQAGAWSILAPDFPEIASVATSRESIAQTATDAIQTAVDVRRENGEPVPDPTTRIDLPPDWDRTPHNLLVHVPVSLAAVP